MAHEIAQKISDTWRHFRITSESVEREASRVPMDMFDEHSHLLNPALRIFFMKICSKTSKKEAIENLISQQIWLKIDND